MSGTTTNLGLPYATGSDPVSGYPATDQTAKTTIDAYSLLTAVVTNAGSAGVLRGQSVIASPSTTQTLPSATANAMVAVVASSTVTGATPVTVAGSNIYGVGLSAASSFKLGAPGAFAILQSDGTNWFVVGGGPGGILSTTTSVTATVGQTVIATGSGAVTVTLPTATTGAEVTVENRSTGGTTVSGSNIQGLGLASASSFSLGTVGASATLLADGTNWNLVAGQQDTGWMTLSLLNSAAAASGAYTPAIKLLGNVVQLSGAIRNNSGGTWGVLTAVATVPAACMPVSGVGVSVGYGSGTTGNSLQISPPTAQLLLTQSTANATTFFMDGASYRLS